MPSMQPTYKTEFDGKPYSLPLGTYAFQELGKPPSGPKVPDHYIIKRAIAYMENCRQSYSPFNTWGEFVQQAIDCGFTPTIDIET